VTGTRYAVRGSSVNESAEPKWDAAERGLVTTYETPAGIV